MQESLRIATRRSRLALWQAEHVASLLAGAHPGLEIALVPMVTEGDRILDRALAEVGGKGLFIKELEVAMFEGRADLAVHSMKDVPADLPEGMVLAAVLERAYPRDALVSNRFRSLSELPQGARVGTSSLRRQCQLRSARPDLEICQLRGNVDTRLRKLDEGEYDAIILAAAGLKRLGLDARIASLVRVEASLPAVGQGVIGIECRAADARTRRLVGALEPGPTRTCLDRAARRGSGTSLRLRPELRTSRRDRALRPRARPAALAISGHNSYWLWGPGRCTGEVMVVIGDRRERLDELFEDVRLAGATRCADCMPYEDGLPIWVARGLKRPISRVWPGVKGFI